MRPHILVPLLLLTLLCAAPAGAAPAAPATEHAPSSLYDSSSPTMPAGAISVHPYAHEQLADGDSLDDYDSEPLTSIADPLEPWNRFWFAFNDIFFLHVAKPVYNFYETVVPQPIRGGVKNFYANILMPKRMINSLLQFRVKEAFVEFGRFCMNTTVGLGGFADVASTKKILVDIDPGGEDFGQTLAAGASGTVSTSSGPSWAPAPCVKASALWATAPPMSSSSSIPGSWPRLPSSTCASMPWTTCCPPTRA